ncbi:MAG: hypothetical protein DI498_02350 [Paracoccus denitrificans]|nr:MAG: hypothetical protein DI498_02350 [Paracoccus denitrificans]PZO85990.1 MAG: hypothetical protein DI633_02350 [Paracoccus denitrificans]
MTDFMILAGVGLCLLSVVLAVIALSNSRTPRGAALTFVLGLVLLIGGAVLSPAPFTAQTIPDAWHRMFVSQPVGEGATATTQTPPPPVAEGVDTPVAN